MNQFTRLLPLASFLVFTVGAQVPEHAGKGLVWAFPVPDEKLPAIEQDTKPKQLAGSTRSYTQEQIDDQLRHRIGFRSSMLSLPLSSSRASNPPCRRAVRVT